MKTINLDPSYHEYLTNIKLAASYLWMSARGPEDASTIYGDAIQNVKKVLQYTLPEKPFVKGGPGMYADEIERLQSVIGLLNILVSEFPEDVTGYHKTSYPETFMQIAEELWGEIETKE